MNYEMFKCLYYDALRKASYIMTDIPAPRTITIKNPSYLITKYCEFYGIKNKNFMYSSSCTIKDEKYYILISGTDDLEKIKTEYLEQARTYIMIVPTLSAVEKLSAKEFMELITNKLIKPFFGKSIINTQMVNGMNGADKKSYMSIDELANDTLSLLCTFKLYDISFEDPDIKTLKDEMSNIFYLYTDYDFRNQIDYENYEFLFEF